MNETPIRMAEEPSLAASELNAAVVGITSGAFATLSEAGLAVLCVGKDRCVLVHVSGDRIFAQCSVSELLQSLIPGASPTSSVPPSQDLAMSAPCKLVANGEGTCAHSRSGATVISEVPGVLIP